jgi:tRNA A-37 threonylcarbamoyl transferase component Bud32/Tfp pilus assembly protein PilF
MSTELRAETLNCPQCGASGEALLANGLCARCLLGAALDIDDKGAGDAPREVGRYRIDGEIAHGGVGIVYRAWQADLQRTVALKMLLPARLDAKDARDRFRREAEVMASLDHPGILPVYEVGVDDGRPYFSMKLAEGGNLAERIPALRGRFRECAHFVAGIAHAIAHAHARGVLHRDLKPSNIVFDAIGQPLITDFGLARFLAQDSSLTGVDAVIGTPRYVAPEVITTAGARITVAADVYGLGAIFYEILTGRAPFAELTSLEVLQQAATRRVRTPREIDAAIPAALDAICMRCLEKRPGDRYASAGALADALDAWLAGGKTSLAARLRWLGLDMPSQRRRGMLALAALAAVAIAAGAYAYATREPIPIPDPATATQTVVVLPDMLKGAPEDGAARRIADRLKLPPPFRVLPYDTALAIANQHKNPAAALGNFYDLDLDAAVGAFIVIRLSLQSDGTLAIMVADDLRQESLFETRFRPGDEDGVASEIARTIAAKRTQQTAEARLSRRALARLLRAIRWVHARDGTPSDASTALKDVIAESPDSAVAHAWLAVVYQETAGLTARFIDAVGEPLWIISSIGEANQAQRIDPTLGFATAQLARAYLAKGWLARATTMYELAQAQGTLLLEETLGAIYIQRARYRDAYQQFQRVRFGTDYVYLQLMAAHTLLAIGETHAGERALRRAMAHAQSASERALQEAEIAWYRDDFARCRAIAAQLEPEQSEGFFTGSSLIRACAIEQGDFAAALSTMATTEQAYIRSEWLRWDTDPALPKAILLAEVGRTGEVGALVQAARQTLQALIDSGNDSPWVWLRMAAAQRITGEIDAAYATLDHAITLGLRITPKTRGNVEFLPFRHDARFAALRDKSERDLAEYRRDIATIRAAEPADTPKEAGQRRPESGSMQPL